MAETEEVGVATVVVLVGTEDLLTLLLINLFLAEVDHHLFTIAEGRIITILAVDMGNLEVILDHPNMRHIKATE